MIGHRMALNQPDFLLPTELMKDSSNPLPGSAIKNSLPILGNKGNYSGSQIIDITCNFLIIFTVNPKVPLTVSPRQFKIFAQMPKMSSWNV
jgi:hypothetical protein